MQVPGLSVETPSQWFVLSGLVVSRHALSTVPLNLLSRGTLIRLGEGGIGRSKCLTNPRVGYWLGEVITAPFSLAQGSR